MDFMPIILFLGVSVPESLALYYMMLVLTRKKESPLFVIIFSVIMSLLSFNVRSIPMIFGIHSILKVILMVIFWNLFFQLSWHTATVVMILTSVVLGLAEGVFVPFLAWTFSLNPQQIISNSFMHTQFTLPFLLLITILIYIISKLKRHLSLIVRVNDIYPKSNERTKKQFMRQSCIFALCLVQPLMLILLNLSFHTYTSGGYPNSALNFLLIISKIVLMFSSLATIFVAGYLLKVIRQNSKLETELDYARMRHNLNSQLQVERHDFNNHLTVIYGYIKAGYYTLSETYIENLYQTVCNLGSLLKIGSPELSAILSAKQEEAKTHGIKFNWYVNMQGSDIPLSPKDLTHLIGNLLDNAIEAAKTHCSPRVDFVLTCNKLGLELKVSNSCSLIPQSINQNIFAAGFTTKDTKQHSGLGLYIVKQIIDRYDGQVDLQKPENYSGVELVIYIPWNR